MQTDCILYEWDDRFLSTVTAAPVLQKDIYGSALSMVVRASISGKQSVNRENSLRLKKIVCVCIGKDNYFF